MIETPKHSVSVAAAIFDESAENVLLIKRRDNGHWEPPGGVLELHESVADGLRREVREETGSEIEVGTLTGVYKNISRGIVALVFNAQALTNHAACSDEAEVVAWVPVEEVVALMPQPFAARIVDAVTHVYPVIRSHDGTRLIEDED